MSSHQLYLVCIPSPSFFTPFSYVIRFYSPVTSNVVANAVLSAISGLQDPATGGLADGMCRFYFLYYCQQFLRNSLL